MHRVFNTLLIHWTVYLGLIALALLVMAVNPAKVGAALSGADGRILVVMLVCVLAIYLSRGVAWWIEMTALSVGMSLREAIRNLYVSQALVYLPGGDMWRVPLVKSRFDDVQSGSIAGAVVYDDLIYYLALSVLMVIALGAFTARDALLGLIFVPQLLIIAILLSPRVYRRLSHVVTRIGAMRKLRPVLADIGATFRELFRRPVLLKVGLVDIAGGALSTSLYALALAAVHANAIGLREIAATYIFGQVTAGLTVVPGALGAYEALMTGLFVLDGVPAALATAAALLYRIFNDVIMAVVGLITAFASERSADGAGIGT
jgi:uncharacterized membrane protein YbhN (UPF0104 family)